MISSLLRSGSLRAGLLMNCSLRGLTGRPRRGDPVARRGDTVRLLMLPDAQRPWPTLSLYDIVCRRGCVTVVKVSENKMLINFLRWAIRQFVTVEASTTR